MDISYVAMPTQKIFLPANIPMIYSISESIAFLRISLINSFPNSLLSSLKICLFLNHYKIICPCSTFIAFINIIFKQLTSFIYVRRYRKIIFIFLTIPNFNQKFSIIILETMFQKERDSQRLTLTRKRTFSYSHIRMGLILKSSHSRLQLIVYQLSKYLN